MEILTAYPAHACAAWSSIQRCYNGSHYPAIHIDVGSSSGGDPSAKRWPGVWSAYHDYISKSG